MTITIPSVAMANGWLAFVRTTFTVEGATMKLYDGDIGDTTNLLASLTLPDPAFLEPSFGAMVKMGSWEGTGTAAAGEGTIATWALLDDDDGRTVSIPGSMFGSPLIIEDGAVEVTELRVRVVGLDLFSGVVDQLSLDPIMALSVRRTTADGWPTFDSVADPIAQIRETGGSTSQTFSYADDGFLNYAGADAHIGVNDGRYAAWRDQAGTHNAAQATTAAQPLYISRGGLDFGNESDAWYLVVPHAAALQLQGDHTVFVFGHRIGGGGGRRIMDKSTQQTAGRGGVTLEFASSDRASYRSGNGSGVLTTIGTVPEDEDFKLIVTCTAAGAVEIYNNNTLIGSDSTGAGSNNTGTVDLHFGIRPDDLGLPPGMILYDAYILDGIAGAADRALLNALEKPE